MSVLPGVKSDRGRCAALGLPMVWRGTVGRIRNGFAVSLEKENTVRARLGLPPIMPPMVPVPSCPDCGSVHHARCNGNGGTAIVLAPGETVHRPAQPRNRRTPRHFWRPCLPVEYRSRAEAAGVDVAGVVMAAIESAEAKHAAPPVKHLGYRLIQCEHADRHLSELWVETDGDVVEIGPVVSRAEAVR